MKLRDYINAVKVCPDKMVQLEGNKQEVHMLTAEFGIKDNFNILLGEKAKRVFDVLFGFDRYTYDSQNSGSDGEHLIFNNGPLLRIRALPYLSLETESHIKDEKAKRVHVLKQNPLYYPCSIMFHPGQSMLSMDGWARYIASAVIDVCEIFMREETRMCLPDSRGWNHLQDLSKIVYFPDEDDKNVQREIASIDGGIR